MQILVNRSGLALVTKANTVISLGWNVWGVDYSDGHYYMFHVYPFRMFIQTKTWEQR